MSIHKINRKTGIRYIAHVCTPNRKQVTKTFKRKFDAERWELEQKHLLQAAPIGIRQTILENSNTTLKAFCEQWLEQYAVKNKTQSSVKLDRQIIANQIVPVLGRFRLNELSQEGIEKWLCNLKDKSNLAPKTCNNCLHLLKKILTDACRWKYLERNETQYITGFKMQKREATFWTRDEVMKVFEFILAKQPELYPVFVIALNTGMRRGEIQALKWDCVDLNRKMILVKRIYCHVEKRIIDRTKGKKDRVVPINQMLFDVLVEQKNKLECKEFVAPRFDWSHAYRVVARLCKQAGVAAIRFHDLRHTFASNLVMQGKPLYDVQKLLGHSTSAMTERYAHLSPNYLNGVTECLNFAPSSEGKVVRMVRS
jgi:integrase